MLERVSGAKSPLQEFDNSQKQKSTDVLQTLKGLKVVEKSRQQISSLGRKPTTNGLQNRRYEQHDAYYSVEQEKLQSLIANNFHQNHNVHLPQRDQLNLVRRLNQ